jgi:pimeloyl-ACP methyl ester carboxylesterase
MPIILIAFLLADLLTIVLLYFGFQLVDEWLEWRNTWRDDYASRCLYGVIGIVVWSALLGRTVIKHLVSKRRKNEDEPKQEHSMHNEQLQRPDGSVINIEFVGDSKAQPILFVHGWNANSTEWYYQKKFFGKDHRLIMIDLPGLGRSKRPANKDFSLQKMATDLGAVIDHLKLRKTILWGHSIGGMVILTYCTQIEKNANDKIRGIILQHTTFTNPLYTIILSRLLRAIQKPVIYPLCYLMIALSPLFWLGKWMSYLNGNQLLFTRFLTFTGTQTPAQLDFISRLSTMAPPAVFARGILGMLKTYDVSEQLQQLTIPTLILGANKDRLTKPVASEYMNKNIPNSELVVLSPAGHQGLVERHEETNAAAAKFIAAI